jgi:hypothetical protein
MTGVFVTFQYADNFDEAALRRIAENARKKFQGMPGLRSKAFTIDAARRRAVNVYVWDADATAAAFFTPALLEQVTGLYGVRPTVDYVQIAGLVENA